MLLRFFGGSTTKIWVAAICAALGAALILLYWFYRRVEGRYYDPAFLSLQPNGTDHETVSAVPCVPAARVWYKRARSKAISLPHGSHVGLVGRNAAAHACWLGAQVRLACPNLTWRLEAGTQSAHCVHPSGHPCFTFSWAYCVEELPAQVTQLFTSTFHAASSWKPQLVEDGSAKETEPALSNALGDLVDLNEHQIEQRWRQSLTQAHPAAAIIGVGADSGQPVTLDLFSDGPHALLAGTTGSGKSVALQVWLQSLAAQLSPKRLRLVLLDYKGGTGLSAVASWPHVELFHTDLDYSRTAAFLRRINLFLTWRKREFFEAGYQEISHWEEQDLDSAPARIVVVLDEFQSMAQSHADLLEHISQVALQGRSLGVHLIVATQKPQSAVAASLRSVLDLRVALRCAEGADSVAILGNAAAAQLPKAPGTAIVDGTVLRFALPAKTVSWPAYSDDRRNTTLWPQSLPEKAPAPAPTTDSDDEVAQGIVLGVQEEDGRLNDLRWDYAPILFLTGQDSQEQAASQIFAAAAAAIHKTARKVWAFASPQCHWPRAQENAPSLLETARQWEHLAKEDLPDNECAPLVLVAGLSHLLEQLEMGSGQSFLPLWNQLLAKARQGKIVLLASDTKVSSFTAQFTWVLTPTGPQASLFCTQLTQHFPQISWGRNLGQTTPDTLLTAEAGAPHPGRYLVGMAGQKPRFCQMAELDSLPPQQSTSLEAAIFQNSLLPGDAPQEADVLVSSVAPHSQTDLAAKHCTATDFMMKMHCWDWSKTTLFIEPSPELVSQLHRHVPDFQPSFLLARPFPQGAGILVKERRAQWVIASTNYPPPEIT